MLIGWLTIVENVRFGQDQVMWIAMAGDGVPIREGMRSRTRTPTGAEDLFTMVVQY